jgi:serine/threonine protein kinase
MPFSPGTKIGRYEIQSLLGAGGMGEVYLAQDQKLGRKVALKILSRKSATNPQTIRRFTQEARAASSLNHSNIAHIYEIDETEELNLISMEYVDGITLRQRVVNGHLTLREALNISIQVASALAAAHAAGIIHRDIKAENVMVTADGHIKVLDFGLAKHIDLKSELTDAGETTVSKVSTAPGIVMGTISYMSPEQARGQEVDHRTDIWSLGVLMYEMICARTPFDAPTSSDVIAAILHNEPPPLARYARGVPETLEWIVMKALTKNPDGRYQTAKELIVDLEKLKGVIEFEAALELSISNDGFRIPERISERISQSLRASISQTGQIQPAQQTSSAEYIVSRIKRHKGWAAIILSVVLVAVIGSILFVWSVKRPASGPSPQRSLMRLTFDSDLQTGRATLQSSPAWSPDGKYIAYSSNRLNPEDFNIWVQQIDGGNPVQVTKSSFHDLQPDWSPDQKSIVFRSERGPNSGLFIIPALGGMERKVSPFGYRPKWAPDGSKIMFLDTGDRLFDYPRLYVKLPDDSEPKEISTHMGEESGIKQGSVAWHPDSRRISFLSSSGDFWTVPIAGGQPVKSEIAPNVQKQMKDSAVDLGNFRWDASGQYLYFEGRSKSVTDIWKITIDPASLRWISGPERLTTGLGRIADIALSPDGKRMAYSTFDQKTHIWLMPFDSRTGRIREKLEDGAKTITPDEVDPIFSDLSRDGKRLVYGARRPGSEKQELWVKALDGSREEMLQADDFVRFFPRWSPDSKSIAYSRFRVQENQRHGPIFILDAAGGEEKPLTTDGNILDYAYDWSRDGQSILATTNRRAFERWEICLFPLRAAPHAETQMQILATDPEYNLWSPRFSPDGQWISYVAQKVKGASASVIYVIPTSGGQPIRITDENAWCDWPRWSSDGKTIYFVSNFGTSFLNVWGVKFDSAQQQPAGKPFQVTSLGSPNHLIPPRLSFMEMSLDQTHLALPITEITGSIWVLDNLSE